MYRLELFAAGIFATFVVLSAEPVGAFIVAAAGATVTVLRTIIVGALAAAAVCAFAVCAFASVHLWRHRTRPTPPRPAFLDTAGAAGALLVSDDDRDTLSAILARAQADGYLTLDQYEDRYAEALAATRRADLAALLEGLPDSVITAPAPKRRPVAS